MSVKLRLRRLGRKKIPVFSIVATDSRNARDGRYIEDIGRYYPLEQPAEVRLDEERVLYWLDNGARPSDTVRSILSKRGLMLRHHLKLKGKSEEEIEEAVNEHLKQLAEKGDDIKVTAEMRRERALEEERKRAEQRRKEAQERAQADEEEPQAEDEEEAAATAEDEEEAAAPTATEESEDATDEPEDAAEAAEAAEDTEEAGETADGEEEADAEETDAEEEDADESPDEEDEEEKE